MKLRLLLDEPPMILLPTLASILGINEALILQQINYWLQASKNEWEGHLWTYNSYLEWQTQFIFLSVTTIGRAIRKLEKMGVLISAVGPNKKRSDRTKWYRIDHDKLGEYLSVYHTGSHNAKMNGPLPKRKGQRVKLTHSPSLPTCQNEPTLPDKNTTEIITESSSINMKPRAPKLHSRPIFASMQIEFGYPEKTDKDPIPNYGKEAKAIDRMVARGYSEDDILAAWQAKVRARGEFVSMVFVNEDIGKPDRPRQGTLLPKEDDLVAQAKERNLV